MADIFLAEPDIKYQKSFENYVLSYRKINDEHYFSKYKEALVDFQNYLAVLYNYSQGIELPRGIVAYSTFWLIDKEEVVGVVRIRHKVVKYGGHIGYDISPEHRKKGYGNFILKLALEKAKEIGLKEVILTCNINNIASRKIIEQNNGRLLGTIFDEEEKEHLYKYSIKLAII